MTQKVVTETRTVCRALDQAGDVCGNKALSLSNGNHAKIGGEGREMIIGDLRSCRGNFRKQGTLTHVRETNETNVRNYFKFQNNVVLFHLFALLREVGSVTTRRRKTYVTLTAVTTARNKYFLSVFEHVANQFARFFVANERTQRHFNKHVLAALTKAFLRTAHTAVFRKETRSKTEGEQVVHILVTHEIHVAALTAVTAVGTARGFAFVGFEGIHTIAAVACFN